MIPDAMHTARSIIDTIQPETGLALAVLAAAWLSWWVAE